MKYYKIFFGEIIYTESTVESIKYNKPYYNTDSKLHDRNSN